MWISIVSSHGGGVREDLKSKDDAYEKEDRDEPGLLVEGRAHPPHKQRAGGRRDSQISARFLANWIIHRQETAGEWSQLWCRSAHSSSRQQTVVHSLALSLSSNTLPTTHYPIDTQATTHYPQIPTRCKKPTFEKNYNCQYVHTKWIAAILLLSSETSEFLLLAISIVFGIYRRMFRSRVC